MAFHLPLKGVSNSCKFILTNFCRLERDGLVTVSDNLFQLPDSGTSKSFGLKSAKSINPVEVVVCWPALMSGLEGGSIHFP